MIHVDLTETDPHQRFRHTARSWLRQNLPEPLPAEVRGTTAELPLRRRWARQLAGAGYAGIDWPEQYGGAGLGLAERAIWNEEWARARWPETFEDTCDQLGSTLLASGSPEQCARYLHPMLVGDDVWCQGFSEPDAGSDLASLSTRAVQGADGQWRITGQKIWTSNAHWAKWCYVLARTSDDRHRGLTFFLVPMDQAGIDVRPLRQMSGEKHFAEVFFDRVEAEETVGEVGEGWTVAMTTLAHERFTRAFRLSTQLRNDLDDLRSLAGRTAAQPVRQELAWLESRVRILQWLLRRDLTAITSGAPVGARGSLHKLLWCTTDQRLYELTARVRGAATLLDDADWTTRYYWRRSESIYAGTNEIQHNIIAERILGLPRVL
jgi:alkylation response protein AidB-like acyl-CoA dehydrogenase